MILTNFQLCLAHYCDIHGPTPLMVTEGLPIPCTACATYSTDRLDSSASTPTSAVHETASISEALRRLNIDSKPSASAPASDQDGPTKRAALRRATQVASATAVDTPPVSPRYPADASPAGAAHARRDSSYRRTYDETTTRRAGPCENCAMTLPKKQKAGAGTDIDREPTLRTRVPYARVYGNNAPGDASPPNSASTESDDDEAVAQARRPSHRRTATVTSTTSRSSASSASATTMEPHTHYLHYTSTHEPVVPSSFSIVRASCIRTLSFETLPRGTTGAACPSPLAHATSPTSASSTSPGYVTTHTSGAVTSGGPIFFGDPSAGYTTAYIFRIPDVHARGHKRVYAFLALSTHHERLAMKAFTFISSAFGELASWIQGLAEAEAERHSETGSGSPLSAGGIYSPGGIGSAMATPQQQTPVENAGSSGFLASGPMGGLTRRMGGGIGYGSGAIALKARGLAELVGMPDFFLELHQRFVQLLLELGVVLSS